MPFGTWVNGEPCTTLSVTDRGLNYGDGLFTTILVAKGHCCLLNKHLKRLQDGIKLLGIAQIDFGQLIEQLSGLAKDLNSGVIKVVITRGDGVRGYSSVGCTQPTVIVNAGKLPTHYPRLRKSGISVGISTIPLGLNPVTAGLKHLNRLEQVLVRQQIDQEHWDDAIVLDCQGFIVESNLANIFWVKDNILYTPSLDLAGVEGVMREFVMEKAAELGLTIKVDRYRLSSVTEADEIFVTNSLMQLVPVVKIEERNYKVGDVTSNLAKTVVVEDASE